MRQLALDITLSPAATFENFVTGRNAELVAHVRAAITGRGERFLYVWGGPGSGRTHLLRAAAAQSGDAACYFTSQDTVTFDERASLMLVDDVELLNADAQIALFHRFNALRESGGSLIASGDVPPVQLKLRADLVTRLSWGLVLQMHPLTDDEKVAALAQRAHARGFTLSNDVIAYLLTHAPRNTGALFATLDALDRYALEAKRAVTVPLVREWLALHAR